MASESANFAVARLKNDKWILARIYEGFLLPQLSFANTVTWRSPSRSRILEASVSAFENAGESEKQYRVLEWILSIGERKATSPTVLTDPQPLTLELNTVDWARGALAARLLANSEAKSADLERALSLLQAIESPQMTGFHHLKEGAQKRLADLAPLETAQPSSK